MIDKVGYDARMKNLEEEIGRLKNLVADLEQENERLKWMIKQLSRIPQS